jgi:hypothetical protein
MKGIVKAERITASWSSGASSRLAVYVGDTPSDVGEAPGRGHCGGGRLVRFRRSAPAEAAPPDALFDTVADLGGWIEARLRLTTGTPDAPRPRRPCW